MFPFSPRRFFATLSALLVFAAISSAQSLKITRHPPGARVELDGVEVGTTPLDNQFPGGYFHRPKTEFGQRLEHPMAAGSLASRFCSTIEQADVESGPSAAAYALRSWLVVAGTIPLC
jgi:hypothetical protein